MIKSIFGQDAVKPDLKFDHLVLFVSNDDLKDSLDKIFTPAEKLTTEHTTQGTIGYYYLFYNTFIELLYLKDSTKARLNASNFGSDYLLRWKDEAKHCPFGFGMSMSPWDSTIANSHFHKYYGNDSHNQEYYLMSNSNFEISQPMIYVSQPNRTYKRLENLDDIKERPEEIREDLRNYLSHFCRVKRLTQITYTSPNQNITDGNLKILKETPSIYLESSNSTSLTLVFDEGSNVQKVFRINDHAELIIRF